MRVLILCFLLSFVSLPAPTIAGGLADPVMESEVVAQASTGSGGGWVVPLVLIALIAAIASASNANDALPPPLAPMAPAMGGGSGAPIIGGGLI